MTGKAERERERDRQTDKQTRVLPLWQAFLSYNSFLPTKRSELGGGSGAVLLSCPRATPGNSRDSPRTERRGAGLPQCGRKARCFHVEVLGFSGGV